MGKYTSRDLQRSGPEGAGPGTKTTHTGGDGKEKSIGGDKGTHTYLGPWFTYGARDDTEELRTVFK